MWTREGKAAAFSGFLGLGEKQQHECVRAAFLMSSQLYSCFLPSGAVKGWPSKPVLVLKGKATWKGF